MSSPDGKPLHVTLPLTVKTYDIDFAGVVSNIVYVRWLEDLRLALLDRYLPLKDQMDEGLGPVIVRTEIDYRRPVRLHESVQGHMWVSDASRIRYYLTAELSVDGTVAATARQEGCFVWLESLRPARLPGHFVEQYQRHREKGGA